MAHWAELDENNIVTRVVVGNNNDFDEGYQWIMNNLGGRWIKTSYNTRGGVHILDGIPLRMNFGEVGFNYDEERDAFIPPKPFESWILNEFTCRWDPPIPYPNDNAPYFWNEENQSWDSIE